MGTLIFFPRLYHLNSSDKIVNGYGIKDLSVVYETLIVENEINSYILMKMYYIHNFTGANEMRNDVYINAQIPYFFLFSIQNDCSTFQLTSSSK